MAIGALFGCACLAAVTLVATTTRSCEGCVPRSWIAGPPVPPEPFAGAAAGVDELCWRDVGRARAMYSRPTTPDAAAASSAVRATLEARGYVLTGEGAPEVLPLPLETRAPALAGACGVVVVTGLGNATIAGAEAAEGVVVPSDPSVVALAACGDVAVRASGIGSATVEVWLLPGITPSDVASTGLPVDAVLAHAEAEHLWTARGWSPVDAVVRTAIAAGPASWVSPPGAPPASGCIAWVGVAIGAGSAESTTRYTAMGRDYAIGRGLFGAVQCATAATTQITLADEEHDGFVVYWRPYGTTAPGPTRTAEPGTAALRAGALRVLEASEISVPDAFAELPAPP